MPTIPQTDEETPSPDAVTLSPFYHSTINEITKPNSLVFISHYFARKWAPDLGALGVAIVVCLRDQCYHDRQKGEKRDLVRKFPVREIARACQVSEKTIRREFDRNITLKKFVVEEYEYKPGRVAGSVLEDAYSYRVAMDDPIHPSDEQKLLEIVRAKAVAQEKGTDANTREAAKRRAREAAAGRHSTPRQNSTPGQIDQASPNCPGGLDRMTGALDSLTRGAGQFDQASIVRESLPIPENQLNPSSDDSLSLFEEEDPDQTAPSAEEIAAARAAIAAPPEPPRKLTSKDIEAEWVAIPPEGKERYRTDAIAQLQGQEIATPTDRMIEPVMFKLYWVERKGLKPSGD